MDQGHLLMPKMYALLYWSTPLTLYPAPHYPLWNETFIIPWCGGANGNRLYSIPPWDSGHWTMGGRKEKSTWAVGVAGHCFSLVHQSESNRLWALFKSKMCRLFHEAVTQVVDKYLKGPLTEISVIFLPTTLSLWTFSYPCNHSGVLWVERITTNQRLQ